MYKSKKKSLKNTENWLIELKNADELIFEQKLFHGAKGLQSGVIIHDIMLEWKWSWVSLQYKGLWVLWNQRALFTESYSIKPFVAQSPLCLQKESKRISSLQSHFLGKGWCLFFPVTEHKHGENYMKLKFERETSVIDAFFPPCPFLLFFFILVFILLTWTSSILPSSCSTVLSSAAAPLSADSASLCSICSRLEDDAASWPKTSQTCRTSRLLWTRSSNAADTTVQLEDDWMIDQLTYRRVWLPVCVYGCSDLSLSPASLSVQLLGEEDGSGGTDYISEGGDGLIQVVPLCLWSCCLLMKKLLPTQQSTSHHKLKHILSMYLQLHQDLAMNYLVQGHAVTYKYI